MTLKQLIQDKREDILKIATKHGAFNVRVFGSVARGEETENSDIDFLISSGLIPRRSRRIISSRAKLIS
jgi:predicted nucleotidyltransferase